MSLCGKVTSLFTLRMPLNRYLSATGKVIKIAGKYVPLYKLPQELLYVLNTNISDISDDTWKKTRNGILTMPIVSAKTIDATIMELLLRTNETNKVKSYIKFLKNNNYEIHLVILLLYLKSLSKTPEAFTAGNPLTIADQKEIEHICCNIIEKYPHLDEFTCKQCIVSICWTDKWKKALPLLKQYEMIAETHADIYNPVISAAFRNSEPNIGWEYLNLMKSKFLSPSSQVFLEFIRYYKEKDNAHLEQKALEMIQYWYDNNIVPTTNVSQEYLQVLNTLGWNGTIAKIDRHGVCSSCNQKLQEVLMSNEDFNKLSEYILQNQIIGKDIYYKSDPEELQNFMRFLKKRESFDIVIDGLNVLYFFSRGAVHDLGLKALTKVVKHFELQGKKILVLCGGYLAKSVIHHLPNTTFYFTKDKTSDDLFLLYATLASGKHAKFLSRDFMRQHRFQFKDPHLYKLFERWQSTHQYFILMKNKGNITIKEPCTHEPYIQDINGYWHIPYTDNIEKEPALQKSITTWVCIRQSKSKPEKEKGLKINRAKAAH